MLKKVWKWQKSDWWADEEKVTFATCSSSLLKAALVAASCTWISNQTISSLVALWVISVILNGSSYLAASVTRLTFLVNLFTQHTEVTSVLHTWSWTWDRDLLLVVQPDIVKNPSVTHTHTAKRAAVTVLLSSVLSPFSSGCMFFWAHSVRSSSHECSDGVRSLTAATPWGMICPRCSKDLREVSYSS